MRETDAVGEPDDPESMRAGDPEFEQLWDMPYGDFRKIENDPQHPLHAKALVVGAEIMEPFAKALQASTAPTRIALTENLGAWAKTALKPLFDASAHLTDLYNPHISEAGKNFADALGTAVETATALDSTEPVSAVDVTSPTTIDFTADAVPEGFTVGQVHDAAQARVVEQLAGMVRIANEQLDHARSRARVEDERADEQQKRDKRLDARHLDTTKLNRWGVIGGWTAAGLTVVSIVISAIIDVNQVP